MKPALGIGIALSLLAGTASAQSLDGTTITPQVIWTSEGMWNFGWPWQGEDWYINLNGVSTGGIGSKLVYADNLIYTLGTDRNWWVWYSGWYRGAPPPLPRPPPSEAVLRVPQTHATLRTAISEANADKSDRTYVIDITSGTYRNEFFEVNRPMTLRAVGGPVILEATVPPSNGKAIAIANADLTVDGLTFRGVRNSTQNGAGIRDHNLSPSGRLTVRNSTFSDNDTGILTDNRNPNITITVEDSRFINNGAQTRNPHALYVNSGRLKVSGSSFCGQLRGHNIKSRASVSEITGNQIYDGAAVPDLGCREGSSGMAIDISNGGVAEIRNNKIVQGPGSPNFALMAYGMEGLIYPANRLVVTGNTFSSPGTAHSTMLRDPTCTRNRPGSVIADNIFESIRTMLDPASCP